VSEDHASNATQLKHTSAFREGNRHVALKKRLVLDSAIGLSRFVLDNLSQLW
jgi:hypothetical protein